MQLHINAPPTSALSTFRLPMDPADTYYERLLYRRLLHTRHNNKIVLVDDSLFVLWVSKFLVHFCKGVFVGTGMYWTLHLLSRRHQV